MSDNKISTIKLLLTYFFLITLISAVGYASLFYGGHISESKVGINAYLLVGEVLMWPWLLLDFMQGYFSPQKNNLELYSSWFFQYISYFFVFFLIRKIKK